MMLLCAYDTLQRPFCHADEAGIQEYAPEQNILARVFQHTIYYITMKGTIIYTHVLFRSLHLGIVSVLFYREFG